MNRRQRKAVRRLVVRVGLNTLKGSAGGSLFGAAVSDKGMRRENAGYGALVGGGASVITSMADELVRLRRKPWWRRRPW